ncbi:DUF305 domain-containing protein [Pseudonocardia hydrocarbonoxydans]|uniref:DUF305 domain-containing protein n=1 Tax=Pseudonocardia hydrocarbonoxydans TaxID=76726 RepID=A0A4Y3WPL7_9PSEU|nr:DUF305 domain-containing protein [Pseudonocardia hydrocarbonoxydans]GEC19326.1 DUF305 domain-containing protein [Pseudonocardia hydrocarbonoxydans]
MSIIAPPSTTPLPTNDGVARWVRPFVAVAAVVGLLLLGAAGGLLLGLPGSSTPEPGPVDIGFSQDMSVHHLQAVEMAAWERDHTTDPVLAQIATDIEKTQNNQVGQMQGWLALWDAPALPIGGYMGWMAGTPGGHGHADPGTGVVATMPGMASSADLAALRAATGPALDILFLQLILRHHEGGAEMLRDAAANASVPQVRSLATQMLSSQASEMDYLRQLLLARGGTPLPL